MSERQAELKLVRLREPVRVHFKFLSRSDELGEAGAGVFQGESDLLASEGKGLLLYGSVPDPLWLPRLLTHDIVIGVNLVLPTRERPVKCLGRVHWIEPYDDEKYAMGLEFDEIPPSGQEAITRLIIKHQLRGR